MLDLGQRVGDPRPVGQVELQLVTPGPLAKPGEEPDADLHRANSRETGASDGRLPEKAPERRVSSRAMKAQHTLIRLAVIAAGALAAVPATASAGIWTPTASGTTDEHHRGRLPGARSALVRHRRRQDLQERHQQLNAPGVSFNDLAMNPSGTAGVAVANGGKLYRFNGTAWSLVSLANTSYTDATPCNGGGGPLPKNLTPTGNLTAVAWSSDTTAYVTSAERGIVLKTTNGGASWSDASRQSDGECFVDRAARPSPMSRPSRAATSCGSSTTTSAPAHISSNGLASSTLREADSSVNCPDQRPQLALDTDNPNRSFVIDRCDGSLVFGFSDGRRGDLRAGSGLHRRRTETA